MKFIIIRHAETIGNRDKIVQDYSNDSALSELGEEQAERICERLAKEKIDAIFCSASGRCKKTIAPLLAKKKISITYVDSLRERNWGVLGGKPLEEVVEWYNKGDFAGQFDAKPAGAESFNEVLKRVSGFLGEVVNNNSGKCILIVTHATAKRALLMNLLEKFDVENYRNFRMLGKKNASYSVVEINETGKFDAKLLYSYEHLDGSNMEEIK